MFSMAAEEEVGKSGNRGKSGLRGRRKVEKEEKTQEMRHGRGDGKWEREKVFTDW